VRLKGWRHGRALKIGERRPDEQRAHDEAVVKLAEARFAIDGWEVTTNVGDGGGEAADIVAVNDGRVVAIGEVETSESVSDGEAEQWKRFGQASPRFYLFVPEGCESAAAELLDTHEVACAGLRCYSYSNGQIRVKSVEYRNGRCRPDDHPWWQSLGRDVSIS
jgi:hypothetical protein